MQMRPHFPWMEKWNLRSQESSSASKLLDAASSSQFPPAEAKVKQVCMIAYTEYRFDGRVRREAETLAASQRFRVTVLCLKEHVEARFYTMENVLVRELGVAKYKGTRMTGYYLSYLKFLLRAFFVCSGLVARGAIDIAHVHNMPNLLVLAALMPKLCRKKVILDMHDTMPELVRDKFGGNVGILESILRIEEKLSARMSDKIICVNHVQKDALVGRGIPVGKMSIFMNVPDHKKFTLPARLAGVAKRKRGFKLVYHGTVTERLGIDIALQAVAKLEGCIPGIEFHLWGAGVYFDSIRKQHQESGSKTTVFFHTRVPIEKLSRLLSEMDVGLIPNKRSAATQLMLPVKMLEYIALGIPVIAPRLKAIEFYFSEDMITYFEPDNVDDMASAILRLSRDDRRRAAQQEKAREFLFFYGWEKQSVEFVNFYLGL